METIEVRFLAEFLNEILACEQTSATLCRMAAGRQTDPARAASLEMHASACRHHERVCRELILEMGGEPGPAPAAVSAWLDGMEEAMAAGGGLEPELRRWLDIQTLLDCAGRCQQNWELLAKVGECNGDPAILKAVARVGSDEIRHAQVLRDALFQQAPEVMLAR